MRVCKLNTPEARTAIRIDRRTVWGNPHRPKDKSIAERNRVCDLFEIYAQERHRRDPSWLAPLKGHDVACWCAPKRCHGDTLIRLANDLGLDKYI